MNMTPVRNPNVEEALEDENRYDAEMSLGPLCADLSNQLKNGHYDLEVNLAILKLYLMHPKSDNMVPIMKQILMKALTRFPSTDFALCMYQIPEKYHNNAELKPIIDLAALLELSDFKKFWEELKKNADCKTVNGLEDSVRKFIVGVVGMTYSVVSSDELAALLNVTEGSTPFMAILKENGWTKTADSNVIINADAGKVQDNGATKSSALTLQQLQEVLASVAR